VFARPLRPQLAVSPSAHPSWFLLGQISGTRSSPVHSVVLGHIQQIRCRANFAIPSKSYQEYNASNHLVHPTVQHISSHMQSHPRDASRSYSYQHHHQTSLSPSHHPNYIDYSVHHSTSGRPMDYHPVAESSSTKTNVRVPPRSRAYTHSPLSELISTHTNTNSSRRRQPRCFAKPFYCPIIRVVLKPPSGLSA